MEARYPGYNFILCLCETFAAGWLANTNNQLTANNGTIFSLTINSHVCK